MSGWFPQRFQRPYTSTVFVCCTSTIDFSRQLPPLFIVFFRSKGTLIERSLFCYVHFPCVKSTHVYVVEKTLRTLTITVAKDVFNDIIGSGILLSLQMQGVFDIKLNYWQYPRPRKC